MSAVHAIVAFPRGFKRSRLAVVKSLNERTPVEGVCPCCRKAGGLWEVSQFPFARPLPCGQVYRLRGPEDVPLTSVPCPCGTPGHWFVLWADDLAPVEP